VKKEDPDFTLYKSCTAGALTTRPATSAYLRKTFTRIPLYVSPIVKLRSSRMQSAIDAKAGRGRKRS
jgi:hypothetical protein